jgi:restriction system protein
MSRRQGFLNALIKASHAAAQRQAVAQRRQVVAVARAQREAARNAKQQDALNRLHHHQGRSDQADSLNADIEEQIAELTTLLSAGLSAARTLDFGSLRKRPETRPFKPGQLAEPEPAPMVERYAPIAPTGIYKLLPGARRKHEEAFTAAMQRYEDDAKKHANREADRAAKLAKARAIHETDMDKLAKEVTDWNAQIDQFEQDYRAAKPAAITDHCRLILDSSDYPDAFPK